MLASELGLQGPPNLDKVKEPHHGKTPPISVRLLENLRQNGARVNEGLKDSIPFLN